MHWMGITENNFSNLPLLVVITSLSTLLPLPLLGWLPPSAENSDASEQSALHSVPLALDLDPSASKHLEQPFIPDLVTELVNTSNRDTEKSILLSDD
jgi:hypothetical protein